MVQRFNLTVFDKDNRPTPDQLKEILRLNIQLLASVGGWNGAKNSFAYYGMMLPEGLVSVEVEVEGKGKVATLFLDGQNEEFGKESAEVEINKSFIDKVEFDDDKFKKYRDEVFNEKRLECQGHHVFVLSDSSGKICALAAGDVNNLDAKLENGTPRWQKQIDAAEGLNGRYFRLLNVVVDEERRRGGVGTTLLIMAKDALDKREVVLVEGPVSEAAQDKGLDKFYKSALEKLDLQYGQIKDPAKQLVLTTCLSQKIENSEPKNRVDFRQRVEKQEVRARSI